MSGERQVCGRRAERALLSAALFLMVMLALAAFIAPFSPGVAHGAAAVPAESLTTTPSPSPTITPTATPTQGPSVRSCSDSIDLVLVLDGSDGLAATSGALDQVREFARHLVDSLEVSADGGHAGVVEFGGTDKGRLVAALGGDRASIDAAISAMDLVGGQANMVDGLQRAQDEVGAHGRPGVRAAIVFVTASRDGNADAAAAEANRIRVTGVEIFAVGVGEAVDRSELSGIASRPGAGHLFTVAEFGDLPSVAGSLLPRICQSRRGMPDNTVRKGGFENNPLSAWSQGSSGGYPVICDPSCANDGSNYAHGGTHWAWFGGVEGEETSFITQTVTIPWGSAVLLFWLRIPTAYGEGFDRLTVLVDDEELFSVSDFDSDIYSAYRLIIVPLNDWADGATHTLRFEAAVSDSPIQSFSSHAPVSRSGNAPEAVTNFFVDDIVLTGQLHFPALGFPPR